MITLWNILKGKKTYLVALCCMGAILLKAVADQTEGHAVDWSDVLKQLMACVMTMTLRHGMATSR